ncbi:MAG: undecaprenyldiphospho-muramoylpentapeptide beta-N-acetylglucosaminyltransferase [Alteromonadaceae bacterium]|uniref:undecaprenyldiphospho-muramoylpentapeptide beta-N-acetylglucosaminyltransferase n=1 Tax=Marinobacter sp. BGYM27 TaxID=2975597 RepID=UPI000C4AEAA3|nr:undecaprenyldiphospho-muramoylpentapeptide beta-N-acetylglucosaminyltransferase [Marinobacter sp. BGYM27]MAA66713.1 undecaprenyldiphospho-muramoylpentapeptide beta-N-acetylglucosaminyltransferase [Alteromonadaceae bacterium]MBH84691.1 undecaprenyldiphospho-muramoylpentapeptide beta-N-acetylglucosaminyltransferase [Alteromonadaceae bacterium]MDG5498110.1 undecaprenyldiphospho-muramoylpentapeptide beta-N-acetylglucosaminyltransferase [Marinobacter sp. BGYM27]
MKTKRFLIMAGGTGGHVFPALATARLLQQKGHNVEWLGSVGGMEQRLIGDTDIPMSLIAVSGLRGKGRLALLMAPFRLVRALVQALGIMRRVKPDCVIGMGGFVTGPGGVAAWLTRTPLLVHEQNAIAGMTNRILARFAKTVMEAFPGSFGKQMVTRCTGNPVRQDLASLPEPAERLGGRSESLRLLVLGGSLGAQAINTTLPQALALMPEESRPTVRHQCGTRNLEDARRSYQDAGVEVSLEPFIEDMAEAYGWADAVLCRAGALTIAELCAVGLGAILVPFPHAVDDHQTQNGQQMVRAGAAILIPQNQLNADVLAETLATLTGDRNRVIALAQAARSLARADATERVVNYCLEAAHG